MSGRFARSWEWVLALAIALVPRLALLPVALRSEPFVKYTWAAEELRSGRGLGDRLLDFSPLYLDLHVAARALAADPRVPLTLFHLLLGAGAALLVWASARALGGRIAGLTAAALYSGYGALIGYEATLEPEALLLFLVAALLALGLLGRSPRGAALAGLAAGLCVSTRPNGLMLIPFALAALLARPEPLPAWRPPRARRILLFAAGLAAGALPLALALARGGGGVGEAMSGGQVFHQGTNPDARGLGVAYPPLMNEVPERFVRQGDYAHEIYREIAAADLDRPATAAEADRLWRSRALLFVERYPGAAARLLAAKAALFLSSGEVHDVPQAVDLCRAAGRAAPLPFVLLAALGIAGALVAAARPRLHILPLGILAAYAASALALFVTTRQRLPAAIPLALFGGIAVASLAAGLRRKGRGLALPAAALVASSVIVLLAARAERPRVAGYRAQLDAGRRSESLQRRARAAYEAGKLGEYRRHSLEAAYTSPDILLQIPRLTDSEATRFVPGAEPAISSALPGVGGPELAFLVGRFYVAAGEYQGASLRLRGLESHPWFGADAANLFARAAIRTGREPEALAALERTEPPSLAGGALRIALRRRAGHAGTDDDEQRLKDLHGVTAYLYEEGRALQFLGEQEAAGRAFAEAARRWPDLTRASLGAATCRLARGDAAGAVEAYETALSRNPDAFLSSLDISRGYGELLRASPDDARLRARLGESLLREGRPDRAIPVLSALLAERPSDDAVRRALALALAQVGRMADARSVAGSLGPAR